MKNVTCVSSLLKYKPFHLFNNLALTTSKISPRCLILVEFHNSHLFKQSHSCHIKKFSKVPVLVEFHTSIMIFNLSHTQLPTCVYSCGYLLFNYSSTFLHPSSFTLIILWFCVLGNKKITYERNYWRVNLI